METERNRDSAIKRDRGSGGRGKQVEKGSEEGEDKGVKVDRLRDLRVEEEGEVVIGVRRRMEIQKRNGTVDLNGGSGDLDPDPEPILVHVCAALLVLIVGGERTQPK